MFYNLIHEKLTRYSGSANRSVPWCEGWQLRNEQTGLSRLRRVDETVVDGPLVLLAARQVEQSQRGGARNGVGWPHVSVPVG